MVMPDEAHVWKPTKADLEAISSEEKMPLDEVIGLQTMMRTLGLDMVARIEMGGHPVLVQAKGMLKPNDRSTLIVFHQVVGPRWLIQLVDRVLRTDNLTKGTVNTPRGLQAKAPRYEGVATRVKDLLPSVFGLETVEALESLAMLASMDADTGDDGGYFGVSYANIDPPEHAINGFEVVSKKSSRR